MQTTFKGFIRTIAERGHACIISQSPNPSVLVEWPHAIHLLGHIYNKSL